MSQLNFLGHECSDEVFERQVYCEACMAKNLPCGPYEFQWDQEQEIACSACQAVLFPESDLVKWKDSIQKILDEKDIIVFQRPTDLAHLKLMKKAKKMGKKIVQTADDDYINVPLWNTGHKYYTERRGIIEETFRICDAMDVTTPYLQNLYSSYCKKVDILVNSQDIDLIDVTPGLREFPAFSKSGERLTMDRFNEMRQGRKFILWGGSPTHEKDLEVIVGAARRITRSEKVVFGFVGYIHRQLMELIPADSLCLFSLVPCMQYFMLYKGIKADIGLAPVCDVPFNHGKSSNKAVEYQIMKILPMMSDLVTYQGCSPRGIYCGNLEYEWFRGLREAVHMSDDERLIRVEENRKYVEDNYDIKKNVTLWERLYGELL